MRSLSRNDTFNPLCSFLEPKCIFSPIGNVKRKSSNALGIPGGWGVTEL